MIVKSRINKNNYQWHCCGSQLDLGGSTKIMGILNVTPDSFSDGGKFSAVDKAVNHALYMQQHGADIIDVGGESTRPGAASVSIDKELQRVIPVIQELNKILSIPISIDTTKSRVAELAVHAGAEIINDISGAAFDPDMPRVIAETGAGCVLMHIQGTPKNMQNNPSYSDVIQDILSYFSACVERVVKSGVKKSQIVLDPGIGFGKKLNDNYVITRELSRFVEMGYPILYAPSRKSFIGNVLNTAPEERVEGTIAAATAAILNGVHILRVHDVLQLKRAAVIADLIAERTEIQE